MLTTSFAEQSSLMNDQLGGKMKEVVEFVAQFIVNSPDKVKVTEENSPEGVLLRLEVDPDDKGRVIGKQGRVAQAMRTVLRVAAAKKGTRVQLEIV